MAREVIWEGYGKRWVCENDAHVRRDNLEVSFVRTYVDDRDCMCDALNAHWVPADDFTVSLRNLRTGECLDIVTKDKRVANWIWYLAKKRGYTFEQLRELYMVGTFR